MNLWKTKEERRQWLKFIDLTATAAETESIDVTATGHVVFGTGIRRLDVSSRAGARRLRYVSLPSRYCIVKNTKRLKKWFHLFVFDWKSIFKWTYRIGWGKLWGRTIRFQFLRNPWWNPPSSWRLPTWRNAQFITIKCDQFISNEIHIGVNWSELKS